MPSTKISALNSKHLPSQEDLFALAIKSKPGPYDTNAKIRVDELFTETLSASEASDYNSLGSFIPGRWYRIDLNYGTAYVMAKSTTEVAEHGYLLPSGKDQLCWTTWKTQPWQDYPALLVDERGQQIYDYWDYNWPISANFQANIVRGANSYSDLDGCFGSDIRESIFQAPYCSINNSSIYKTQITEVPSDGTKLYINNCVLKNVVLTYSTPDINPDTKEIYLTDCHFENVYVQLTNNADVRNLQIYGKYNDDDGSYPIYAIDGRFQGKGTDYHAINKVLDYWAGVVIADKFSGSSTVRAYMYWVDPNSFATRPAGNYIESNQLYFGYSLPIGEYIIPDFPGFNGLPQGSTINLDRFNDWLNHPVRVRVENMTNGTQINLITDTSSNVGNQTLVEYHGITTKVHQLHNPMCYVDIFQHFNYNSGLDNFFLRYGAHYEL